MTRWLLALGVAVLVIAAGWVVFLNPEPVVLHVTPERVVSAPLAVLLLAAFVGGAALVSLATAVRASARGWRRWRSERRAARAARREASTARARELLWAGDYARAQAELTRSDDGAPDPARIALLAEAHLHQSDHAGARTVLEQGIAQVGLEPRLLDLLADAAERSGDMRGAIDALERARTKHADSPRLARRLRDAYAAAERWQDALALQTDLLLRIHDPAVLASEKAIERGLRHQLALAEPDARRAAQMLATLAREDPDFLPARVSAGDRLLEAGRHFTARRTWERGARHRPAPALLERLIRLHADRPARVSRFLRRLQRRHPDAPAVPLLLVRHLLAQGELDAAAGELEALPASAASRPQAHALWGELHRRRGNHTLAAESLARVVETGGGGAAFHCSGCQRPAPAWAAYCAACRRWNTFTAADA